MTATQWPPWDVTSLQLKLEDLAKLVAVPAKDPGSEEAVGWLARLLVVRSSGYVEQVVAEVARSFVAQKSGGLVRSFARSWLERTRNPSPANLEQFIGRFDSNLCDEFKFFLDSDDERLRRELEFLVDRRNRIAHGLSEGIGSTRALALRAVAIEIGDWFILRFNPH
jgi:HEPN superfamily RiboL-PSP-like protein